MTPRPRRRSFATPGSSCGRRSIPWRWSSTKDRIDRLRAFASALGSGLKGKVWLVALGQQKVDEQAKALVEEIRSRLMEHIRAGRRVRLQ